MKKNKKGHKHFKNTTLMPDTNDDKVSNRIIDNEDFDENNNINNSNESDDYEMNKEDFYLKLFMIVY